MRNEFKFIITAYVMVLFLRKDSPHPQASGLTRRPIFNTMRPSESKGSPTLQIYNQQTPENVLSDAPKYPNGQIIISEHGQEPCILMPLQQVRRPLLKL